MYPYNGIGDNCAVVYFLTTPCWNPLLYMQYILILVTAPTALSSSLIPIKDITTFSRIHVLLPWPLLSSPSPYCFLLVFIYFKNINFFSWPCFENFYVYNHESIFYSLGTKATLVTIMGLWAILGTSCWRSRTDYTRDLQTMAPNLACHKMISSPQHPFFLSKHLLMFNIFIHYRWFLGLNMHCFFEVVSFLFSSESYHETTNKNPSKSYSLI